MRRSQRTRAVTSSLILGIVFTITISSAQARLAASRMPAANTGLVVSLSDIHFDPFYDTSLLTALIDSDHSKWQAIFSRSSVQGYGSNKADTNYVLFNSALKNIYRQIARPDFIIISGDFLAHDFQENYAKYSGTSDPKAVNTFITKTIAFVTWMIEKQFPQTPVYPALGNNDSYCGDYAVEPGGQFLGATANTWKTLLRQPANVNSFMQTFPALGSYSVLAPRNKNHRIIVLNATFFSNKYKNSCGDPKADPARDEMKWLEGELKKANAAREKVWLVYHIPPGIDVYASLEKTAKQKALHVEPFWQPDHNQQFINLIKQYSTVIVGSFTGHIHMDSFQLVRSNNDSPAAFVHITPAISPLFDNNPAFEIFTYDRRSSALNDYTAYYLDLASAAAQKNSSISWTKEYTFTTAYGQPALTAQSLQVVYDGMLGNEHDYRTKFDKYYDVSNTASPGIDAKDWRAYWCGMTYLTVSEYTGCIATK